MENAMDMAAFTVVVALPLIGWFLSRPPVWSRVYPRLERAGAWLWRQLAEQDEPDEQLLQRWALARLEELQAHLARVRRLLRDDSAMSATRQMANRLAHDQLRRDIREAETALAAFGPIEPVAVPTPVSAARFAVSTPTSQPAVELIEFGPRGRWF